LILDTGGNPCLKNQERRKFVERAGPTAENGAITVVSVEVAGHD
jgi:hypothetical protein